MEHDDSAAHHSGPVVVGVEPAQPVVVLEQAALFAVALHADLVCAAAEEVTPSMTNAAGATAFGLGATPPMDAQQWADASQRRVASRTRTWPAYSTAPVSPGRSDGPPATP